MNSFRKGARNAMKPIENLFAEEYNFWKWFMVIGIAIVILVVLLNH